MRNARCCSPASSTLTSGRDSQISMSRNRRSSDCADSNTFTQISALPILDRDADGASWTQRHGRKDLDRTIICEWQSERPANRRQQQNELHHRKIIADTLARAAAKREISVLRKL